MSEKDTPRYLELVNQELVSELLATHMQPRITSMDATQVRAATQAGPPAHGAAGWLAAACCGAPPIDVPLTGPCPRCTPRRSCAWRAASR